MEYCSNCKKVKQIDAHIEVELPNKKKELWHLCRTCLIVLARQSITDKIKGQP